MVTELSIGLAEFTSVGTSYWSWRNIEVVRFGMFAKSDGDRRQKRHDNYRQIIDLLFAVYIRLYSVSGNSSSSSNLLGERHDDYEAMDRNLRSTVIRMSPSQFASVS